MPAVYHSCPAMPSHYARGGTFPTAQDAQRHAQKASEAHRLGFTVYAVLDGRPKKLATFTPPDGPSAMPLTRKEIHP